MTVHPEEYMGLLVDYCMLKINAVIRIKETNQAWSGEDDFIMDKTKIKIQVKILLSYRNIIMYCCINSTLVSMFPSNIEITPQLNLKTDTRSTYCGEIHQGYVELHEPS